MENTISINEIYHIKINIYESILVQVNDWLKKWKKQEKKISHTEEFKIIYIDFAHQNTVII